MEFIYQIMEILLPFAWIKYTFMKNALLATFFVTVALGMMGTMVVSQKLVFFTDVIGHAALTGLAIGVLFGIFDPTWTMVFFAVSLAVIIHVLRRLTRASMDTVLGVIFAFVVALGIVILSREGGFAKYANYLIGDILTISISQIAWILSITIGIVIFWSIFGNALYLISINPSLAKSRGHKVFIIEMFFTALLAIIVTIAIRSVGILVINSMLVLPAAASRIFTRNVRDYTVWAILISLTCGIVGLIVSYYCGTATGATIVLLATGVYTIAAVAQALHNRFAKIST